MSDNIIEVSDQDFKTEVLGADVPVLVDFWAPWCPPCRMIAPFIEQIAKDYNGKVKVVKCNIDENPSFPNTCGVTSIPTLVLFKNGEQAQTSVGAMPYVQIKAFVEKAL
ncbi:MAG: thioredoxin [Brevinema sp.]